MAGFGVTTEGCPRAAFLLRQSQFSTGDVEVRKALRENEMEEGPGGKQIQLEDPDGNPLELFEPAQ